MGKTYHTRPFTREEAEARARFQQLVKEFKEAFGNTYVCKTQQPDTRVRVPVREDRPLFSKETMDSNIIEGITVYAPFCDSSLDS